MVDNYEGEGKKQRDGKEKTNEGMAGGLGELGARKNASGTRGAIHKQVAK